MSQSRPDAAVAAPRFAVDYVAADSPASLLAGHGVLAVFGFGDAAPATHADPRYLHIPLQPHAGVAPYEVWRTGEPVACGRDGEIAWASNGQLAFGVIEVEESTAGSSGGGITAAATHAYARLTAFVRESGTTMIGNGRASRSRRAPRRQCPGTRWRTGCHTSGASSRSE